MQFGRLVSEGSNSSVLGRPTTGSRPSNLGSLTASVTSAEDFKQQQELLLSPQSTRMQIPTASDHLSANGLVKEDRSGDTSTTVVDVSPAPAERIDSGRCGNSPALPQALQQPEPL